MGITFSAPEELRRWREQVELTSPLLSDGNRAVGLAWGAADAPDQEKAKRVSVLVGADGRVEKVYPSPDPATHADEVLADLG